MGYTPAQRGVAVQNNDSSSSLTTTFVMTNRNVVIQSKAMNPTALSDIIPPITYITRIPVRYLFHMAIQPGIIVIFTDNPLGHCLHLNKHTHYLFRLTAECINQGESYEQSQHCAIFTVLASVALRPEHDRYSHTSSKLNLGTGRHRFFLKRLPIQLCGHHPERYPGDNPNRSIHCRSRSQSQLET